MDNHCKVKIIENGPYQVSGEIPLNQSVIKTNKAEESLGWEEGKKYDTESKEYYLCRCGHSKTKPFCDGSHQKTNFDGEETANTKPFEEQAYAYEGETIDLLDQEDLCASGRFCDQGDRIWNLAIASGNPENRKLAIEEANNCPSGRLIIIEKDGTTIETPLEKEISLVEDVAMDSKGAIWVKGGIPVVGANGEEYEVRQRVTLCRCGESSNKPFCDATHLNCPHMQGLDK